MRKILSLSIFLLLLVSCSKNEDSEYVFTEIITIDNHFISYDNKYGIIYRSEDNKGFIGMAHVNKDNNSDNYSYSAKDIVWEKQISELEAEKVDIGYGKIEYYPYNLTTAQFFQKTYNIVVQYEAGKYGYFKYLYFYDEKGNLLNKSSKIKGTGQWTNTCPWEESKILIKNEVDTKSFFHVFDKNGNEEIYSYTGENEVDYMSWKNINNKQYFAYSKQTICLLSLNDAEIEEINFININKLIFKLFPNEKNTPEVNNIDLNVSSNNSIANIEIVFYSGEKKIIEIVLDNQTGKIIN